jgi:hypothetical protein
LLGDLDATSTPDRHGGVFWGSVTGARAGSSLACTHDVTGDGLADLWIGAPYADGTHDAEGAAYLISGRPEGPRASGDLEASADGVLRGEVEESWLGASVATGRFDADDLADIAVGAPGASASTGDVEAAAPGEVLGWSGASFRGDPTGRQDIRITGEEDGDRFGSTVAFADVDGDGFDDLLVGAPYHNPDPSDADSAFQSGALYVFLGGFTSAPANLDTDDADYVIVASEQFLRTGARFTVGDYDVDGEADIVVINRYDPGSSLFE